MKHLLSAFAEDWPAKRASGKKKMFGGLGFLLHGHMVVGVWKNSMIVRVGSGSYDEALLEPHVKEFDITGKPMKGWLMVEPQGVDDDRHVKDWIQRALKFVGKLSAKEM
jgi:TfoX/Sxy family transcriptional regulator of competence genes